MRVLIRKVRTILRLAPRERRQALATIALMGSIRIALWVVPFRILRSLTTAATVSRLGFPQFSAQQIVWAIRLASRYVPRSSCLTQALTAQILLNSSGLDNRLQIGVAKSEGFESHAWIEHDGRILLGGAEQSARYTKILTLNGNAVVSRVSQP